jgi:hypothetical protein
VGRSGRSFVCVARCQCSLGPKLKPELADIVHHVPSPLKQSAQLQNVLSADVRIMLPPLSACQSGGLFAWDGALVGVGGGGWFRDSRRWTVRDLRHSIMPTRRNYSSKGLGITTGSLTNDVMVSNLVTRAMSHHGDRRTARRLRCATVKAQERTTIMARISPNLLEGLDDSHKRLYDELVNDLGQAHLFLGVLEEDAQDADPSSSSRSVESAFQSLLKQLHDLDQGYTDGGLAGYVRNAKKLLEDSRLGVNPLSGWVPSVPDGQVLEVGSAKFNEMERLGLPELGATGFVLVAGGLGERLGYSDIKVRRIGRGVMCRHPP